jgi:hypothetical protein
MKPRALLLLATSVLMMAGSTAAYAELNTDNSRAASAESASGNVTAALASSHVNTFERPARDTGYTLNQWSTDGWNAPWDTGLSTRSRIDDTVKHSGNKSLRVFYPAGRIDPENSGVSAPFAVTPTREYYLSQWVRFSNDFSWGTTQFGGKMGLGLAGGASCSGGQACTGYNGFSSRMIWRSGGRAAIYYYHMGHADQYGDYAQLTNNGTDIVYARGQWINIVQRLKVNTVTNGNANPDGEIQIWYNGVAAATIKGLRFVRNADLVDRAYFSSFFGGATADFAPKNDSYIWYDDLKVTTNRADICELNAGGCVKPPSPPATATRPPTSSPTATRPPTTSPTTPTAAPPTGSAWVPNLPYVVGQVVTYNGARYRCRQAHTSVPGWEPANVLALWLPA